MEEDTEINLEETTVEVSSGPQGEIYTVAYKVYLKDETGFNLVGSYETLEDAQTSAENVDADVIEEIKGTLVTTLFSKEGVSNVINIVPAQTTKVSKMQAAIALSVYGKLDEVEATIKSLGGLYWIAWNYSDSVELTSPMLNQVWLSLGHTEEELKSLFNFAATIKP